MNVAVIGKDGESTASFKQGESVISVPDASHPTVSVGKMDAPGIPVVEITQTQPDSRIRISPRAKRLAEDKSVNYMNLAGSGPNGRIITADIEAKLKGGATTLTPAPYSGPEYSEKPLSNVRLLISRAMHASLQNSAQLTHHMSADVRRLLEARQNIKERLASDKSQQDITLNDMICWCVIRALGKNPEANSHFLDNRIKTFHKVHLGFAVDTPRGLMVPVVKNASDMNLVQLSAALKSAADSCRRGNISPELLQSTAATFTVSNLGNYGVEMFTPVINLPQVAILGVCTIISRPANIGNNIFGFVPYIGLSLTYDHRSIDGGPATLFLKEIKEQIEAFSY
jgi:pyruvate dehydrogenase E2 component (dihydrolipoamide acetyltransferase)